MRNNLRVTITESVVFSLLFAFASPAAAKDYYVSPSGMDSNPGTLTSPFQTLTHARDVVRSENQNMAEDIVISLRGGYYQLDATFTLSPEDSGTNGHTITYQSYPGETALLSGGKTITNWQADGNKWKANVGVGTSSNRQLYLNGVRATRAQGGGTGGANVAWQNIQDIEVVNKMTGWQEMRCPVASIVGTKVNASSDCVNASKLINASTGDNTYGPFEQITSIENAYELLDLPGEWYLNRATGWLYYLPKTGESMSGAIGILPMLETLVKVSGTTDNPVSNIQFKRLVFAYATWLRPNTAIGYAHYGQDMSFIASGFTLNPANVVVSYGRNITFSRNIFTHLGAVGLSVGQGSKDCTIVGNHFTDISASGLVIGDFDNPKTADDRLISSDNLVSNNYVHDVAVEYHGSDGIWNIFAPRSTISHNEVAHLPYNGISLGFGGGYLDPTVNKNSLVKNNNVYDVMRSFGDGGVLYSSAAQPGNTYTQNYLHDSPARVTARAYGGTPVGLYLDDSSANITATQNVIVNVARAHLTKGTNNSVTDATAAEKPAVIASAGLESAYQDIKTLPTLPLPGGTVSPSTPPETIPGDFTESGDKDGDHVNIFDYNVLVQNFGHPYTIFDYNNIVANYGK